METDAKRTTEDDQVSAPVDDIETSPKAPFNKTMGKRGDDNCEADVDVACEEDKERTKECFHGGTKPR